MTYTLSIEPFAVIVSKKANETFSRYTITFRDTVLREQISRPDFEQCKQAAWHAHHETGTISGRFYNAIVEACGTRAAVKTEVKRYAPTQYADAACNAEGKNNFAAAARLWNSAAGASIGHSRRERYQDARANCLAMVAKHTPGAKNPTGHATAADVADYMPNR